MDKKIQIVIFLIVTAAVLGIAYASTRSNDSTTGSSEDDSQCITDMNPGYDIYGHSLNDDYCRHGLDQSGIVDIENDLWRFQIYTVQPSMVNLKFQRNMM